MSHKKNKTNRPIGIFDSGIGGLTVAKAIGKKLPSEEIIYFGDTAHLPYGDKSPEAIRHYAKSISDFLLKKNCKMIVIACNTASALAYDTVRKSVSKDIPVVNVIDPVVKEIASLKKVKKIGIIGTKGTIRSDIYARKLKQAAPALITASLATPLLAPMIEEGFFNNKISRQVINDYLKNKKLQNISALVLACTHYPLIMPEINDHYKGKVLVIDSASIVAKHVKQELKQQDLLAEGHKKPSHRFYVSDHTRSFEDSTRYFFTGKIQLEKADIWK